MQLLARSLLISNYQLLWFIIASIPNLDKNSPSKLSPIENLIHVQILMPPGNTISTPGARSGKKHRSTVCWSHWLYQEAVLEGGHPGLLSGLRNQPAEDHTFGCNNLHQLRDDSPISATNHTSRGEILADSHWTRWQREWGGIEHWSLSKVRGPVIRSFYILVPLGKKEQLSARVLIMASSFLFSFPCCRPSLVSPMSSRGRDFPPNCCVVAIMCRVNK